ncbi:MAG: molybdopterin-dependent oxidoreductase [Oceanospirillaceae bacterium]|nr:molybdopterin-dependent oxidoreductase [Oceanospirillaceae bacterium]MCP5334483.1 molybdopterin-dependent oxidoreductase [Oceanospirillaceae bacterium]MCP5350813.1 molybdopterin-dependent oxidoreductase [Oceanospirillaceae bacterium]
MTLQTIQTTCAYCGVGCGINSSVQADAHHASVQGDQQHPSNFGRLCSKGTALADTISLNERLLVPEMNGHKTDWDTALNAVAHGFAQTIAQYGPDAVAFYVSGQLLTEDYYVANKLMKGFMGSGNIDTNSRLCMSSSVAGHKRAFGTDTVPGCYADFELADLIVLVGSNTAWCHPVLFQRIKAHKEKNPQVKVVVIDPRKTQTCDIADLHLPLKPGSDVSLFNGLLVAIAEAGKLDADFIRNHTDNITDAINCAEINGDINSVAATCDLNAEDVREFYRLFCATEKNITLYSQGVNQSSAGTDKVNAIINCHLATGRIGKAGMGPFSMTGQPNAMGGREVGGLANTLAAHLEFNATDLDIVRRFWRAPNLTEAPGLSAVDMFDAVKTGRIKAIWIMATNPVVSMPDADNVKAALEACPLVVVSDCVADTDTLRLAHIKLPATGWSEKDGTVTNSERRISRQRALFAKSGEAQHDWWIISEVARRMGFAEAFPYQHPSEIFAEHAALSGFENNATQRLRDFDISKFAHIERAAYDALLPVQWPVNAEYPEGRARFFADGLFFTPSRKARFIPVRQRWPKHKTCAEYPLVLNTGRIRDQWHTMTRTALAAQLNQHIDEAYVDIHPQDAQQYALQDNAIAHINSRWGKMLARVKISANQRRGEIFVPMHWTGVLSRAGRMGALVNPVIDPDSKQPESKHTPVHIKAYHANWYGFILSREPLPWPEAEYLISIKGKDFYRYELAGSGQKNLADLQHWLNGCTGDSISYEDASLGMYRYALLHNGRLIAVAMLSRDTNLPQRQWLGSLFNKSEIDSRGRAALLSGLAPAGEDIGRIVCACFSVGENSIKNAIKGGCCSTAQIGAQLKAGTNCGSCIPEIKQLLGAK